MKSNNMKWRMRYLAAAYIQAVYWLLTAFWGLLHFERFMAVTGPQEDTSLVKSVLVLVIPICIVYFAHMVMRIGITTGTCGNGHISRICGDRYLLHGKWNDQVGVSAGMVKCKPCS